MKLTQHVLMCVLSVQVRITKVKARTLIHDGSISSTKHMIFIFSWTTGPNVHVREPLGNEREMRVYQHSRN